LLADALVKINIFVLIDLLLISQPKGFVSINQLVFINYFFDFFSLGRLGISLLHLYVIVIVRCSRLDFDFFFDFFLVVDVNWEIDKF